MKKEQLLHHAIEIALKAHQGQTDKYGAPYIGHIMRVTEFGKTTDEKIVGALHDTIEDTDLTLHDLRKEGFPENILYAVDCLTRRDNESYDDFTQRVTKSPLATSVKLNDLRDNMDLRRIPHLLEAKDVERLNKYLKAYRYLTAKN